MAFFVTFEGIEGCGKSTQIKLLADYLSGRNHPYLLTREPGGTNIGNKIRAILLNTENTDITSRAELLLYAADRAQHIETVIKPAISDGKAVLCDRFTDATCAYQGKGRGIDPHLISELNTIASGGIQPDMTFLIDCPVDVGLERAIRRAEEEAGKKEMRFESEDLSFHERVRAGYLEVAGKEPQRVIIIDGNRPVEEVHDNIVSIFLNRVRI